MTRPERVWTRPKRVIAACHLCTLSTNARTVAKAFADNVRRTHCKSCLLLAMNCLHPIMKKLSMVHSQLTDALNTDPQGYLNAYNSTHIFYLDFIEPLQLHAVKLFPSTLHNLREYSDRHVFQHIKFLPTIDDDTPTRSTVSTKSNSLLH